MKDKKEIAPPERMRIDKWLKVARLFKTRSQAADACQSRHVKVNGKTVKPSHQIKVGDTITIHYPHRNRTFDVVKLWEKPLPAREARELYVEHLPKLSEESAELLELMLRLDRMRQRERKGKGRPTKKERRQLEKIFGKR
jgi:ribosome-associated heat shock protein Hsp15